MFTGTRIGGLAFTLPLLVFAGNAWGGLLLVPAEFATIEAAADAATTGDTVLVAPGSYIEGRIEVRSAGVVIMSSGGRGVTEIDFEEGGGFSLLDFSGTPPAGSVIAGFTINDGLMTFMNEGAVVRDNRFNVGHTIPGGYCFSIEKSCSFSRNEITYDRDYLFLLFTEPDTDAVYSFDGNLFVQETGFRVLMSVGGSGTERVEFEANTVIAAWFLEVQEPRQWTEFVIRNNIFSGDGGEFGDGVMVCPELANVSYDIGYNCVWETAYHCTAGEGTIFEYPLFCDLPGGDYTLDASSPCVGTGENGANMGACPVGCGVTSVSDGAAPPSSRLRLSVEPNPVRHSARLSIDGGDFPTELRIYSAQGRLIDHFPWPVAGTFDWMPGHDVPAGIYYVAVGDEGGKTGDVAKIVVLR